MCITLATEVLIGTLAVRNIIRERKNHMLYGVIQTNLEQGMHLMDDALKELYESGIVTYDEALCRARDSELITGRTGNNAAENSAGRARGIESPQDRGRQASSSY